uniref:Uncharacterized protein n=1 Tax=Rhizophora mucronata TaxID=61149 RepID=A0A2P2QW76_RHIMU
MGSGSCSRVTWLASRLSQFRGPINFSHMETCFW